MKKIGIVTLYHNSLNYGGVLQAYALCRVLRQMGADAEQIAWQYVPDEAPPMPCRSFPQRALRKLANTPYRMLVKKEEPLLSARRAAFDDFRDSIPHSPVYTRRNISEAADRYDAFICGSDQVWSMKWYNPEYFLSFVPPDKEKFAYAASMPCLTLTKAQRDRLRAHLADFRAVSVREAETAALLAEILPEAPKVMPDPVLLLTGEDWSALCRDIAPKKPYIFCYFLGEDPGMRRAASALSHRLGLPIVSIPHTFTVTGRDAHFGTLRYTSAAPQDFPALCRDAAFILTDSFHASVFACLFGVRHLTFPRVGTENMDSRLRTLSFIFGTGDRFLSAENPTDTLYRTLLSPFSPATDKLSAEREKAFAFLQSIL